MSTLNGFKFIQGNNLFTENEIEFKHLFQSFFTDSIEQDPFSKARKRAYLKLDYDVEKRIIKTAKNQSYFQTKYANNIDGGTSREFKIISDEFIQSKLFKSLLKNNRPYIEKYCLDIGCLNITLGIHFVRYETYKGEASFSSPIWLHIDNEPLVFVHLIDLTNNMLGGDNIVAIDETPIDVIRLEAFMDTLILDKSIQHAVTPMGSRSGYARRDIILFTIEDDQQNG